MATEEKKTPVKEDVKVTSGKDFVAAKPQEQKAAEQAKPKDLGPSKEEIAAHEERMRKLEEDFERRKAEIADEEKKLRDEQQKKAEKERAWIEEQQGIAAAKASRDSDLGGSHFGGTGVVQRQTILDDDDDDEGNPNARGKPIPVTEQNQRVRHISEIGDEYNGKPDTIPGHPEAPE